MFKIIVIANKMYAQSVVKILIFATNSIFGLQHPQVYTLAKRKDDIEILPGTIHPIAKTSLPISAELSSRS